jgi:hypothetical protein
VISIIWPLEGHLKYAFSTMFILSPSHPSMDTDRAFSRGGSQLSKRSSQ